MNTIDIVIIVLFALSAIVLIGCLIGAVRVSRKNRRSNTFIVGVALLLATLTLGQTAQAATNWSISSNTSGNVTTYTVTRTGALPAQAVIYRTVSLSAMAGQHFNEANATLNFPANVMSQSFTVDESTTPTGMYRYQEGLSREYRLELLDQNGFELAHIDHAISYDDAYQIVPSEVFAEHMMLIDDTFKVDDGGYDDNGYKPFPLDQYYAATAPKSFMVDMGYTMLMRLRFEAWEEFDGYQYVQILANQPVNCDNRSGCKDGEPGNINYSGYMAGFAHLPGEANPFAESYGFPVTYVGNNCGPVEDAFWTLELDNAWAKLYNQLFNFSNGYGRSGNGLLIVPTDLNDLGVRFNASGKHLDTWKAAQIKAYLTATDSVVPVIVSNEIVVSPGPHKRGNTVTVSVPFSEIVNYQGKSGGLVTTWGVLSYAGGNGSNVLSFRGTIVAPDSTTLQVNRLTGGVSDLAGNLLQDNMINRNLNVQVAGTYEETDATTLFSDFLVTAGNESDDTAENEHFFQLLDGNKSTKWCSGRTDYPLYVEFEFPLPIVVTGYVLTTGNDVQFNGRNPKSWVLQGKLAKDDEWTVLDDVSYYDLPEANISDVHFSIANTAASYRYFRLDITANHNDYHTELSELQLEGKIDPNYQTNLANATVSGVEPNYWYTGTAPQFALQLTAADGTVLTEGTHYIQTVSPYPYDTIDDYTITLTAATGSGYTGATTAHFSIVNRMPIQPYTTVLSNGEYVVSSFLQLVSQLSVIGTVTLYLEEGANFVTPHGIEVAEGNTLIINGPGRMRAASTDYCCAIGGTADAYSHCGTIIINGGQITTIADGACPAIGCATGGDNTEGSLTLGWTNPNDFIDIASLNLADVRFVPGKLFAISNSGTLATKANLSGQKIVPATDSLRHDLSTATIHDFARSYYYTGQEIPMEYYVTDLFGKVLEKDVDYTEATYPSPVVHRGAYTLSLWAKEGSEYTSGVITHFLVVANPDPEPQPVNPTDTTIYLGDESDNDSIVSANDGLTTNVTLVNRILHRDGHWNTLCVPFDQFLMDDSPLQGADVRELTSATMSDDTLNLTFTAKDVVYQIEAGKPYILRWNDTVKEDLVSPTFRSVTISDSAAYVDFTNGHFQGSFSANTFAADTSIYLLGQGDTIYRPQVQTILGACRAYFLLTDGAPAPARVVIHFEGSGTDGLDPETQEALEPKKILKNGVLYIRREGVVYDALGKKVK